MAYTRTESDGLIRYSAGYSLPVNQFDGEISFGYINAEAQNIEDPISALDIQSDFEVYQFSLRQPIELDESSELALEVKAELINSQTFVEENIPRGFVEGLEDGESDVTALRFIQEYFNQGDQSSLAVRSQFSFGLDLDATVTEVGRDALFWSWQGQAQWLKKISDLLFVSSLNVQLTDDQLLNSSEEIDTDTLASTGLGLGYELGELVEARIDYAVPLIEANAPEDFSTEQEFSFFLQVQP